MRKIGVKPAGPAMTGRGARTAIAGLLGLPLVGLLGAALAASPVSAADANKVVTEVCAGCHTATGNSVVPLFPKLAGMSPEYLAKQLSEIKAGGRKSEVMGPVAEKLSDAEISALAGYFGAQTRTPGIVANPRLIAEGAVIYNEGNKKAGLPACAGCHKRDGSGASRFPMIAAQHSEYVLQQLRLFHTGARNNDYGKLMRTVASRLSEAEMVAVAQYVASLPVPVSPK